MQINFDVFSRLKEQKGNGDYGYLVEDHIVVTEDDMKDLALKAWLSDHNLREDRNYEINIDKIIID